MNKKWILNFIRRKQCVLSGFKTWVSLRRQKLRLLNTRKITENYFHQIAQWSAFRRVTFEYFKTSCEWFQLNENENKNRIPFPTNLFPIGTVFIQSINQFVNRFFFVSITGVKNIQIKL